MKKIFKISVMLALVALILAVNGCGYVGCFQEVAKSHTKPPQSIEIGGVTYVSGFYPENTSISGAQLKNADYPLVEEQNHYFWKVSNSKYDLVVASNVTNTLKLPEMLYCREDWFDEVKAYYEDPANSDYCFYYSNEYIMLPEECNRAYLESAVQYAYAKYNDETFDPYKDLGFETIRLDVHGNTYPEVKVCKKSKDGVLTSRCSQDWYYVDGALYAKQYQKPLSASEALKVDRQDPEYLKSTLYRLVGEEYDYILNAFADLVLAQQ